MKRGSFMWETIRAIHEALGIESTWAFVLIIAGVFAFLSGSVAWVVDRGYKNSEVYKASHAPKSDENTSESVSRIRALIAEGNRVVQTCQSVPDPYHTPAISRGDLANSIVEFQTRAETVLSMDSDARLQKMWRNAVLYGTPEKVPSIALYCTQLNVKMDMLNRILKRKLTTRQQLKGQLERFAREGVSLRNTCAKSEADAGETVDDQLSWISKVMEWLGDNFDETYQDQFNSVAPESDELWKNYSAPIKGPCERMQPRIEVLESIYKELGTG